MNNIDFLQKALHDLHTKPMLMCAGGVAAWKSKLESHIKGEQLIDLPETVTEEEPKDIDASIAVIPITGVIMKRTGLSAEWLEYFGIADLDKVDEQLLEIEQNDAVKTVVLDVNSPGGYSTGVIETGKIVDRLSKKKTVIVYTDILNASAAYWISSQASHILGASSSEIGSIGVYSEYVNFVDALEKDGIEATVLTAGMYKAMGHPYKKLTKEQLALAQSEIDTMWESFKAAVNSKRTVADEDMQGQTFYGEEDAVKRGLLDGIVDSIKELLDGINNSR